MRAGASLLPVAVTAIERITADVRALTLRATDGDLPPFSAGAHVVVAMETEAGPRRNAYSLVERPDARSYRIAVRRDGQGRGGSRHLHDRVAVGDRLAITPPVNAFPRPSLARRHVFVAGGIGVTPFLPMIEEACLHGVPFELHLCARSIDAAPFAPRLLDRYGDRVNLHLSGHGRRLDPSSILDQPLGTHLGLCGPAGLMDAVECAARAAGWPRSHVHREAFAAPPGGEPFSADLASSGRRIRVGADQTLLEAIEAAGIEVPNMCRGGACGACETAVRACDGTILHADHWLSPEARAAATHIVPCVSRFAGRSLVLDL